MSYGSARFGDNGVAIERLDVSAYTVPTDLPESDGTYSWDKTTMVIVEAMLVVNTALATPMLICYSANLLKSC